MKAIAILAACALSVTASAALADYDFRRGNECPAPQGVVATGPVSQIFTDKMEAEIIDLASGKRQRFPAFITAGESAADAPIMQLVQVAYATGMRLNVVTMVSDDPMATGEGQKWVLLKFKQETTDHTYCWGYAGVMPLVPTRKHIN